MQGLYAAALFKAIIFRETAILAYPLPLPENRRKSEALTSQPQGGGLTFAPLLPISDLRKERAP